MNPATLQAARLTDADFLFFLAGAAWGVNAGLALFFLVPRQGRSSPAAERGFWLGVAGGCMAGTIVCAAHLLAYFGALYLEPALLERIAHTAAAAAVGCGLVALVPVPGERLRSAWPWTRLSAVVLVGVMVIAAPAVKSGRWLGAVACAASAVLLVEAWRHSRHGLDRCDQAVGSFVLGCLYGALGVVFAQEPASGPLWNGAEPILPVGGGRAWIGAVMVAAGAAAFMLLWRHYLQACTLAEVRARRAVFGLRPFVGLPVLQAGVLVCGGLWFVAASRQAEDYAARRLQAEVATVIASVEHDPVSGAMARDAQAIRRRLEAIVGGSSTFVAAAGWVESRPGWIDLIAAVQREPSPSPFDAVRLLPSRQEVRAVQAGGGVRWVHGRSAFEQAIVFAPMGGAEPAAWVLSLAVDARDLAGLVSTHRLQALAILGLALITVAFAVVYAVRTSNEAELRLLKESAEAENAGRNAFLGMISHEIRTPLQSVLGYAELAEGAGLPESAARQVRAIRTQGAILLRIVQDILDFSALRGSALTLTPEAVSLRELVDDVQRGMAGRAQAKGIVFSTEVEGSVPAWVTVDRVRLTQVLLNLATNAVKFTDRGGVRVAVGCRDVNAGRAAIEILVSDTGPGISPAQMRRLFEPFRKMRDDDTPGGGGVGLGLAISRQIVELLGGSIAVESVDGEGTAFRLQFSLAVASGPAAAGPGAASAPVPSASALPSLDGLSVLLIDDNPYVRDLLRDFLHKLGARVTVRPDGGSALEVSGQHSFDVILLDLRLPDFEGAELGARLRALGRSPTEPWIVGISAGVSDAEIQSTLQRGVNDFMLKPVSMAGLAETIRMSPAGVRLAAGTGPAVGGAPAFSTDQRAAFFAELEPMFERLEQSCLEAQGRRLAAEAHYLANGCMVAGFEDGLKVCREIEQLAEGGAFSAARQKIVDLRSRFAERPAARGA